MSSSKIIPREIEKFYGYITGTDDCQKAIDTIGFSIYPVDANGKRDYINTEGRKLIINELTCKRWDWTDEESARWTQFRNEYEGLYKKYKNPGETEKSRLQKQLEQLISDCVAYVDDHLLLDRIGQSIYAPQIHVKLFGVRQDVFEYKTSWRTIHINYDKERPFSDLENEYIKKYIALHEMTFEVTERIKKLRADIKTLHSKLPALWEQLPVLKDKADHALNQIFIPPPSMKGAFSQMVSVYIPSPEESQQRMDDYNNYYNNFHEAVMALYNRGNELFDELNWAEDVFDYDSKSEQNVLHKEVQSLSTGMIDDLSGSIETLSLDDEFQNFLESFDKVTKEEEKASDAWEEFVEEENLFIKVHNALMGFLTERFNRTDQSPESPLNISGDSNPGETDDPHTETINRYESDLKLNTTGYYDVTDWHIIMDHYKNKFDNKNKAQALERAMTQHPNDATLLTRQAQEEAGEHRYQKALSLIKEAEAQGPPHHPNLYYTKANIYVQLQTPEPAIPIYKKMIAQTGKELAWWHRNSYDRLIEIYEKQKNYDECIRLCREVIAEEPDNEHPMSELARFYHLSNHSEEAEHPLKAFLEKHPQSAICRERLGYAYHDLKQYEKAIEQFDLAFAIDKQEHYGAIFYKGNALMELKRYDEAVLCYELCLLYFKLNADYHVRAARCYTLLNLRPLATAHYRKALAIDRDCKEALDALMLLQKQH